MTFAFSSRFSQAIFSSVRSCLARSSFHSSFLRRIPPSWIERAAFLKSAAKQIDAEVAQLIRHKPLKNLKRARRFRRDERSLSRGKQMANQIGDGMGFSGARRSLHKHTACRSNLVHNAALLIVRWFWKEDFAIECSVSLFRFVAWLTVIFRANLCKVREFAGDGFAVFDLFLDPF